MASVLWPIDRSHFIAIGLRLDQEANGGEYDFTSDTFDRFNYMIEMLTNSEQDFHIDAWINENISIESPFLDKLTYWTYYNHDACPSLAREDWDPDRRKYITKKRFLGMGAILDAEHQDSAEKYSRYSEVFHIVDRMFTDILDTGFNPLDWIKDDDTFEDMRESQFIQRLQTWLDVYHPELAGRSMPPGPFGIQWPQDYQGPRTMIPGFVLALYEIDRLMIKAAQGQSFDDEQAARDSLEQLLGALKLMATLPLPQLITELLDEAENQLDRLNIPQEVFHSPEITRLLGTGRYMDNNADDYERQVEFNDPVLHHIYVGVVTHYLPQYYVSEWLEKKVKSHDDIVSFVNALPTSDISTIPREDMRCPLCWEDFDKKVKRYNNEPKRVPCCKHNFGKDCLIHSITDMDARCPLCRQDLFEAVTKSA